MIPCLGASGAVSGIMGAYVAIYPLNKIKVWFGLWIGVLEFPAFVVVGLWFLFQYVSAFLELESGVMDGVAYWEHIGGFAAGISIVWGTVFWLWCQHGRAPKKQDDSNTEPASAAVVAQEDAPDPFATFLTLSASHAVKVAEQPRVANRESSQSEISV